MRSDRIGISATAGAAGLAVAMLLISSSALAVDVTHEYRVINFTFERIELRVEPLADLESGALIFSLDQSSCVESRLTFDEFCEYEICAYGIASDDFYGCTGIAGCAGAGFYFFDDHPPEVDGEDDCDDDPFEDDDDIHTYVSLGCFISASGRDGASGGQDGVQLLYFLPPVLILTVIVSEISVVIQHQTRRFFR